MVDVLALGGGERDGLETERGDDEDGDEGEKGVGLSGFWDRERREKVMRERE